VLVPGRIAGLRARQRRRDRRRRVNRLRIRAAAEDGHRSALALERLRGEQERYFAVMVIFQNLCVVLVATAGTVIAVDAFGNWGFLISLVAIPLISAEFGEYTPKVFAARTPERIAFAVAVPVEIVVRVMSPLISALAVIPNLFGRGGAAHMVTEAELRMLIDISAEEGAVGAGEAELLDRVFHFHDRRVNEIMVPRTEVVWLESGTKVASSAERTTRRRTAASSATTTASMTSSASSTSRTCCG
jgi:CBS domain containing-hemolysin-like protein